MDKKFKLNELQIESILDKLVPLIAKPEDHGFFRGLIGVYLSEISSGQAAYFVSNLLKEHQKQG